MAGSERSDERSLKTAMMQREPAPPPVPGKRAGTPLHVKRVSASRVKLRVGTHPDARRTRGIWLVVIAYLAAGAALGYEIYRFAG